MRFFRNIKTLIVFAVIFMAWEVPFAFGQCNQNNIELTGFQLRDQNGNVFTTTDNYDIGGPVNGGLWVYFGGSSKNAYNMNFYFDILINNVLRFNDRNGDGNYDSNYQCMFPGTEIEKNKWVKVQNISWKWGDKVQVTNLYANWDTNGNNLTCKEVTDFSKLPQAQCYASSQVYTAAVPLFPEFDFQASLICNSRIQFTNNTVGGTTSYSYSWNFDGDAEIESTDPNPIFDFPGSGNYSITLAVSDGLSNRSITKDIYIDPNFGIQVTIVPTRSGESTGNITVTQVTGGTPGPSGYGFAWKGPGTFESTNRDIYNLSSGLYTLTVTDSNGCAQ